MQSKTPLRAKPWILLTLTALAVVVALMPWCRNHRYLRDFMDYGLVMAAGARIDAGEHPYADFATPIQCGTYWLNRASQALAGNTYQGMTWGNAALIAGATVLLALLLARRWPAWIAVPIAWAVVCGSASQHTIVWYNSLGVICLALATWASATAPVLRKSDIPSHVLTAAALFLGGVNKLNFHLVALVCVAAWALRAGLCGRASWRRVAATFAFIGLAGVVLPFGAEIAWTGASRATWWHNVLELPAAGRSAYLQAALHAPFYLKPLHDYYGPLALPQIGLAGVALLGLAVLVLARSRRGIDRLVLPAAGCLAAGAMVALLATNHEIGYITLATALVLATALTLGFADAPPRPARLGLALVIPSLAFGTISWWSAWQGQRSQFGHSSSPRAEYRDGAGIVPGNRFLAGTLIPPEAAESLAVVASILPQPDQDGLRPVFYGPGLEFLECLWPATKTRGVPLWLAEGTSCGPLENALIGLHLADPAKVRLILVSVPWENWPSRSLAQINFCFVPRECGNVFRGYLRRQPGDPVASPLALIQLLGGNLHPAYLRFGELAQPSATTTGRNFVGSFRSSTVFRLEAPCNRLGGTAVLRRQPGAPAGPFSADFAVRYTRPDSPGDAWRQTVTLPAGADETTVEYAVDARQQALEFAVEIPAASQDAVCAGWMDPRIHHAQPGTAAPPSLFAQPLPDSSPSAEETRTAMPPKWSADAVVLRGARIVDGRFELPAGGELWLRADRPLAEWLATVSVAAGQDTGRLPVVRLLWAKGGRLEILTQTDVRASDHRLELRAWSAEPEGWIGVLIDPNPGTPPAIVHIDSARNVE